jgi:hypothetical protein
MATITPGKIVPAGVAPTYNAASAGGDKVAATSNERDVLHVKNGGGSSVTVTIAAQVTSAYVEGAGTLTVPDLTVAVPATTGDRFIAIPSNYVGIDGTYNVSWSATTSVTFAGLQLPAISKSFN